MSPSTWTTELRSLIEEECPVGTELRTLSTGKPNWVMDIAADGVWIHTEKSKGEGGPKLVDGWMVQVAWDHLEQFESLTNGYLLRTDGLNVKRSSAVCAILSRLPGVGVVSSDPITLVRRG